MSTLAARTPITVAIAPDSFKGSLSAAEAAAAMAEGARAVFGPDAVIVECPMADGGEGTLEAILAVWGVPARVLSTFDALGRPRQARVGVSADGRTAVIEAAEANGLPAVMDVNLQPLRADTFGVGILARDLLDEGVDEILLCVGGSASTDGGTGLLTALGARFRDREGRNVAAGGAGLADIRSIDVSGLHTRARAVLWRVAVDVTNPLCGARGAASVFGPQKGALPADVALLDTGLATLCAVVRDATGIDMLEEPGAGAAGGMPATLVPLLGAEMIPGSTMVADAVGLADRLAGADFVLTGEGRFDSQSLDGKVVEAVTRLSPPTTPVIVIAGSVGLSAEQTRAAGVAAAFSIANGPAMLAELQEHAYHRVRDTAAQVCALI
ncbi:glycerate kinase [Cryobacterium roopkundense]|uniref:Glycerate kinase n=1 Tax=Cryobacterium roopkundense TaxID=1001240 RepID=A0A099J4L5_9MICO|nr:glycerate kinase [Cryobacterium roopkundense]KGJ72403.1 glycerate kinase [Cryobacterium roopkundense]MBB5640768.1 glycerate kinase [Cryobacterium roopkundense]